VVADPGQQPDGPASAGRVGLGAALADLAGLVEGGLVVVGQPGQAGDGGGGVEVLHREGHGPLDQPLNPSGDGRLLGKSTGHRKDPNRAPRHPGAQPTTLWITGRYQVSPRCLAAFPTAVAIMGRTPAP
jgi:hypothetical protein